MFRRRVAAAAVATAVVLAGPPAWAQDPAVLFQGMDFGGPDLSDLSLEELADVEITSVSRRAEPVSQAAASVFVITAEDIRRSGAPSLPDVLRLAPNLQVQRMNAGEYAITARGFNGFETSNKLLVLVDGRSVYSPLHSGVFWDSLNIVLEEIDRIEIISGPGGTLWGSNAVNGIINIITRSARESQGTLASVSVGTEDSRFAFRHGGEFENGAWRAFITGFARDDTFRPTGGDATDALAGVRAGFRTDWTAGESDFVLQGHLWDINTAEDDNYTGDRIDVSGGHLLGRWTQPMAGGETQVQAYLDHSQRVGFAFDETVQTADLHIQHARLLGGRHQLVFGGGYRWISSELVTNPIFGSFIVPEEETIQLTNLFLQDQFAVTDQLTLTLGVKFEDNSFSGQEWLPSARLAWTPRQGGLLWAAASRATRTPNRIERGLYAPGFLEPRDFQSELLTAYEIGYRAAPRPNLSFSVTAFYHAYDQLRTVSTTPVTVLPLYFTNNGAGETWGVEAWGAWQVNPRWRLSLGVQTLDKDISAPPGTDITGVISQGQDPDYQVLLRSQADLTDRLQFDASLRAVGELITIEEYVDLDLRLGWEVNDQVELSISGRDLLTDERVETADARRRAFGRSVFATVTARF
ncbi:TonB-dependent receptor [Brevundimonas sp.]|uniref:TonB-dependent receptor plug domain-containing protein n=1 Tax=Brevundimonas sp. TaxID=1871086 RepID=UPI0025DD0D0E|nr:TonB-dependent receptor [Brevundimonas sp.]